ncbi:MAG: hypothetical protein PSV24_01475 [Rhodoferax sp.]|nr:hypothetical protein [Rhodoferax sp.]
MFKKSGFVLLLAHGMAAMAQTVSGNVFCAGTTFDPSPASVSVSGTVAAPDTGLPGAVWVGIEDPAKPGYPAAFLSPSGWAAWTTGGFPTYVETPAMGSSFSYTACIPSSPSGGGCAATSADFVGWNVYAGYGVLTLEHQTLIAKRRASLDLAKPWLQQRGKWRADYDDDLAFRNALIQKSANDGRWGVALTVPYINCTPLESGGQ